MSDQPEDDELEDDDGTVLDDDERVEDPPSEEELATEYEGEREAEPQGQTEIDDVEPEANPENPEEPIIPDEEEGDE